MAQAFAAALCISNLILFFDHRYLCDSSDTWPSVTFVISSQYMDTVTILLLADLFGNTTRCCLHHATSFTPQAHLIRCKAAIFPPKAAYGSLDLPQSLDSAAKQPYFRQRRHMGL